jgi:DNA-binding beta-propeller fold protein YncE
MRFVLAASIGSAILVFIGSSGGCGKGLFPEVTSSGTATATPVANAFLYATNFGDGTVSAFTRNTNTGALTFIAKQSAGAVRGPQGIAITPQKDFAYVANSSDGNVYGYSINSQSGSLTSVGSGIAAGSAPKMVAIEQSGAGVYVTNTASKTLSEFIINAGSGTLSANGTIGNFVGQPFGIVAHPSAEFVYVSDSAGFVYAYAVASDGTLSQIGTALNSNGGSRGNPGLMAIAFDGSQGYVLVDDTVLGVVSMFSIQSNGGLIYSSTSLGTSSSTLGIGAALNQSQNINYVLTANTNGNFVQPFQRSGVLLSQQSQFSDSSAPTGLTIDPAGAFAYTGNSGNGTIALIGINNSQCGTRPFCVITNFASESPANSGAGTQFVAMTN